MVNYPTSISQYVTLGKLLSDVLNIRVAFTSLNAESDFGPGWSHQGSAMFGVTNGSFGAAEDAYADLAAHCLDACYGDDNRYKPFVTEEGRVTILASIYALSSLEGVIAKSKNRARESF